MSAWIAWLYHYGIGASLVAATVASLRFQGRLRGASAERRCAVVVVAALLVFALVHALWIALVAEG